MTARLAAITLAGCLTACGVAVHPEDVHRSDRASFDASIDSSALD